MFQLGGNTTVEAEGGGLFAGESRNEPHRLPPQPRH
jgi:hypothetical protein